MKKAMHKRLEAMERDMSNLKEAYPLLVLWLGSPESERQKIVAEMRKMKMIPAPPRRSWWKRLFDERR